MLHHVRIPALLAALFLAGCVVDTASDESELRQQDEDDPGGGGGPPCPSCGDTWQENWNNLNRCLTPIANAHNACIAACHVGADAAVEACVADCDEFWIPLHCPCYLQAVACGLNQQHSVDFFCSFGGGPVS